MCVTMALTFIFSPKLTIFSKYRQISCYHKWSQGSNGWQVSGNFIQITLIWHSLQTIRHTFYLHLRLERFLPKIIYYLNYTSCRRITEIRLKSLWKNVNVLRIKFIPLQCIWDIFTMEGQGDSYLKFLSSEFAIVKGRISFHNIGSSVRVIKEIMHDVYKHSFKGW